ncbi:MAG TPA: FdtA/QdtA family cupin domain-containing protein [Gemmataceae bacterium]|jgi:dTDP-4-dehydrorhamnose 3,5-epimerase-like enzyme
MSALNLISLRPPPKYSVQQARIIQLPRIQDPRGNLTFIQAEDHVPFDIKRVYYIYDVPGGSSRGGHAHKSLQQLMIAMAGSFDVILDDSRERRTFHLNRSYYGLYIPPMLWRELDNFSSGSVCMVLASKVYEEEDYYRNYEAYRLAMRDMK